MPNTKQSFGGKIRKAGTVGAVNYAQKITGKFVIKIGKNPTPPLD